MQIDPEAREIQAVVVAPTRELAKQIGKQLFRFTKYCAQKIFVEVLTGGDKLDHQIAALQRPTQVVVVTPGRLLDLLSRTALSIALICQQERADIAKLGQVLGLTFVEMRQGILCHTTRKKRLCLFFSRVMEGRVIITARMKKTFPLHLPDQTDSRVIAAIQVTLNKYVKRERRKALPTGADGWDFQCRVGANPETAQPCQLPEIPAGIEAVALAEHPGVYVEILAEPRPKIAVMEGAEQGRV